MSCLIIGDGPSKGEIDMNSKYDVDAIICVHYPQHTFTDYVCSCDLTDFHNKETLAIRYKIPLIVYSNAVSPYLEKRYGHYVTKFKSIRMRGNSGAFAIEWAISKGFKTIYTAGLDFYSSQLYITPQALANINQYIKSCKCKIYKATSKSLLHCDVLLPLKIDFFD